MLSYEACIFIKNTKVIPIKEAPYNKPGMKNYLKKYIMKGYKDK